MAEPNITLLNTNTMISVIDAGDYVDITMSYLIYTDDGGFDNWVDWATDESFSPTET